MMNKKERFGSGSWSTSGSEYSTYAPHHSAKGGKGKHHKSHSQRHSYYNHHGAPAASSYGGGGGTNHNSSSRFGGSSRFESYGGQHQGYSQQAHQDNYSHQNAGRSRFASNTSSAVVVLGGEESAARARGGSGGSGGGGGGNITPMSEWGREEEDHRHGHLPQRQRQQQARNRPPGTSPSGLSESGQSGGVDNEHMQRIDLTQKIPVPTAAELMVGQAMASGRYSGNDSKI